VVVNQPYASSLPHPSLQRSLSGEGIGDIERNSILHDVNNTSPAQLPEGVAFSAATALLASAMTYQRIERGVKLLETFDT
jgi:hypothetical protein